MWQKNAHRFLKSATGIMWNSQKCYKWLNGVSKKKFQPWCVNFNEIYKIYDNGAIYSEEIGQNQIN